MIIIRILADILIIIGCFFALAGVIGIIRMPDTFSRVHSSMNIATLGIMGLMFGTALIAFYSKNWSLGIKVLITGMFILLTKPISSHAMIRFAHRNIDEASGKMVCDEYRRDNQNE